ncbi:MAG: FtsX-like permease family protein, partial [Pyrinomonadaceae bacterium]
VETVDHASIAPMTGNTITYSISIEGYVLNAENTAVDTNIVGPEYHHLMGIPIIRGRDFTEQDRQDTPPVVIINEAMARLYFPGQDPIGKFIGGGKRREIIGIVRDSKYRQLTEAPLPHMDLPLLQRSNFQYLDLHVRTTVDPLSLISAVQREIKNLNSDARISNIRTLSDWMGSSIAAARMASMLTGLFGIVALLLAAVGLYGVLSYSVNRRTREIGIRIAVGAQRKDVLKLVLREGMILVTIGIILGVAGSLALTRLIASLLYGVSVTDPLIFITVSILLFTVALLACYIPARRAMKIDPIVALRYE